VEPNTDSLTPVQQRVGPFLDDVAAWAAERDDVRAAVLLGSQARVDTPADHLSDVDVVLFVQDPARLLQDAGWLERFGEPLLTFVEQTAVGGFEERRVLFRDGLEVDFAILPAAVAESPPQDAAGVFARGYRVLYDGIGLVVPQLGEVEPAPPTQAQLDQLSNDFWYHLLWAAKKLRRGELLQAKQACDCFLKGYVVELTRWRRRGVDTWHGLRFFERWAGDDIVEALGTAFARYEADDIERALRATGELFGELEDAVAGHYGLRPPVDRSEVFRRLEALTSRDT
jgi:aminoglycoside 6-adenylyltransferase